MIGPALTIAQGVAHEIAEARAGAERGERLRAVWWWRSRGANAGKSTLLNALRGARPRSVPNPSTTRSNRGASRPRRLPVLLLDTAGSRSDDTVSRRRSPGRKRASEAV